MLNLNLFPGRKNKSDIKKKYKIGIALSGGGSRGFAHLGVLQALAEKNIHPEIIAGASAGAIVGVLIASGKNPAEAFEFMKIRRFTEFSQIHVPDLGLFSLEKLRKKISESIKEKDIKDLKLPMIITVTNLNKGTVEYLDEGPLDLLVMASSSIPILFSPVKYNGYQYVDGGLLDNLPVEPLKDLCEKVIAINVNPVSEMYEINNFRDMALRTFLLNVNSTLSEIDKSADVFIAPPGLDKYNILDPSRADEIYQIGYNHTRDLDLSIFS